MRSGQWIVSLAGGRLAMGAGGRAALLLAAAMLLGGCFDSAGGASPPALNPSATATTPTGTGTARSTVRPTATIPSSPSPSATSTPQAGTTPKPAGQPTHAASSPGIAGDLSCDGPELSGPRPTYPPAPELTAPPAPSPSFPGADAEVVAAITAAGANLAGLESYQFTAGQAGRSTFDLDQLSSGASLKGTLIHGKDVAVEAQVASRILDPGAAVTFQSRLVIGAGQTWEEGKISGDLEPAGSFYVAVLLLLLPEGLVEQAIVPFAGGFSRAGDDRRDGVPAVRYTLTNAGKAAYSAATGLKGQISGDVWIANSGGYLVSVNVTGQGDPVAQPSGRSMQDGFTFQMDITNPNDRQNVVHLPTLPKPDRPAPAGDPVDLRLEYDVLPAGDVVPTADDVAKIAVSMRQRLEVYFRPTRVAEHGTHLTVIDCRTTTPDNDRRLISTPGLLSVVPLSASLYGTVAAPGPRGLPIAGTMLDPLLPALPHPGRAGIVDRHVDPSTGRRGLALILDNDAADDFRSWSATHPNEFFAVVLDGVVLATLGAEGRSADGHFVFTGDYSEAQIGELIHELYSEPLLFPLRLVSESRDPAP